MSDIEVFWQVADARAQEIADLRAAVASLAVANCKLRQRLAEFEGVDVRAALAALRRESGADDEFGALVAGRDPDWYLRQQAEEGAYIKAAQAAELKTGAVA